MRILRHDFDNPTIRHVVLLAAVAAIALAVSLTAVDAQDPSPPPNPITYCENPTIIPLGSIVDGDVAADPSVVSARGGEVALRNGRPAIRLPGAGSRVQVTLPEPMLHTQWVFGQVDHNDVLRVDATAGGAVQPLTSVSTFGAIDRTPGAESGIAGWTAAGTGVGGAAQVDVHLAADVLLFSNVGSSTIELVAATGCPALVVDDVVQSPPTWNPETQRFVARYSVTVQNNLPTRTALATIARQWENDNPVPRAPSTIDDVVLDLDVRSPGFRSATITELEAPTVFAPVADPLFDGVTNTRLFVEPRALETRLPQTLSFEVAYEPDFADPVWSEGVSAPTPRFGVEGAVDGVRHRSIVLLGDRSSSDSGSSTGNSSTTTALADQGFVTPAPALEVRQQIAHAPRNRPDGTVAISELVTITNSGETDLDEVSATYNLAEMYGPGTQVTAVTAIGTDACSGQTNAGFDGSSTARATLIDLVSPLRVGETCSINIRATVLPGIVPSEFGSSYQGALIAQARSGVLEVTGRTAVQSTLRQTAELTATAGPLDVENLTDGTYRLAGNILLANTGDQRVADVGLTLDAIAAEPERDREVRSIVVEDLQASGGPCRTAPHTDRLVTAVTALDGRGIVLEPGSVCRLDIVLRVLPGRAIEGWSLRAGAYGSSSRRLSVDESTRSEPIDLPEAPEVHVRTVATEPANNADGSYTFDVTHTVRNAGDVPLTAISISDTLLGPAAGRVDSYPIVSTTCDDVSPTSPLMPDGTNTCEVRRTAVVRPGSLVRDWTIKALAAATSVSGRVVEGRSESAPFDFDSAPALDASLQLRQLTKSGPSSMQVVLDGSIVNRGDIVLAGVNGAVDLGSAFGGLDYRIDALTSTGLTIDDAFDGGAHPLLLDGSDSMDVGDQHFFQLTATIESGFDPGPISVDLRAWGVAPSRQVATDVTPPLEQALPVIRLVDTELVQSNEGDGSYEIVHEATVENIGGTPLEDTSVRTDFTRVFGAVAVSPPVVTDTCIDAVLDPGGTCSVDTRATIRPGIAVGPYEVATSVTSVSDTGVPAIVGHGTAPADSDDVATSSLRIREEPSIAADVQASEPENNGDGTYSVRYRASVSNEGDVPLYEVAVSNGVAEAFGDAAIENVIVEDSCSIVSTRAPLDRGATCSIERQTRIRPLTELGPWAPAFAIAATSPGGETVEARARSVEVEFAEVVAVETDVVLEVLANNGDGTYELLLTVTADNAGDVPIVDLDVDNGAANFGDLLLQSDVLIDSCADVAERTQLLPAERCTVQASLLVRPGATLGPWEVTAVAAAAAASGTTRTAETTSDPITLPENPAVATRSTVRSVENNGDGSFRVITDIDVENLGDVRLDRVGIDVDLDRAFGGAGHEVEGLISSDVAVNEQFASAGSGEVLHADASLEVGETATTTIVVRVVPGDEIGPFRAPIVTRAVAPSSAEVVTPGDLTVDLPAVAVQVVDHRIENRGDGSYAVETDYEIGNRGTTPLESLRIIEDLDDIYGSGAARLENVRSDRLAVVEPGQRTGPGDLLLSGARLDVGQRAEITTRVIVVPGNSVGPFRTVVLAVAESPTGTEVADLTEAERDVIFEESPALRVDQRLVRRPVWNPSGSFDVTFAIDIVNEGDIELREVQIREDLLHALGADSSIVVGGLRSENLTPNPGYDGLGVPPVDPTSVDAASEVDETGAGSPPIGDTRVLAGTDTLAAGASGTIEVDLTIMPERRGLYNTRVVASALSPAGVGLGTDNEIEATTITRLTVQGELGVAKQVIGEPSVRSDGSIDVTYEILVENAGPFPLTNVEIHDQLNQAFGVGSRFATSTVRTDADSPCAGAASSTFDGGTNDPVLISGVELQPAEACRVQYDAVVTPQEPFPGPFRSSAFAIASDPFGGTVIDDSTDGAVADPDGNEEPGDNDLATSVSVQPPEPRLGVRLAAESTASEREWFDMTYRIVLRNSGPIDVVAPRLAADLDEQWSHEFRVNGVRSDDLRVLDDFDGDREIRLLAQQNRLAAGEEAVVELDVSVRRNPGHEVGLAVTFDAVSVAGDATSVLGQTATATEVVAMADDGAGSWSFDELSTAEKRMLLLGGSAFLVLAFAGYRHLRRRWLARLERRALGPRAVLDVRHYRPTLDLRDEPHSANGRNGSHPHRRRRVSHPHPRHQQDSAGDRTE